MLLPIGPQIPDAFHTILKSFHDAITALETPAEPKPVFAIVQAKLPPAASYPQCVALVSDLNILAHSDGVHWIRRTPAR